MIDRAWVPKAPQQADVGGGICKRTGAHDRACKCTRVLHRSHSEPQRLTVKTLQARTQIQGLALPGFPGGEIRAERASAASQVGFQQGFIGARPSLVLAASRKGIGTEGILAPQEPSQGRPARQPGVGDTSPCGSRERVIRTGKGRMWDGEAGTRLLEGELADVVETPLAVVVPPGAVVRGLRHAVLQRTAIGLVGAERVRPGAGVGTRFRAGRAVPGKEGHALAVLEEVETFGAPVVHAQPHRPVVGSERRAQVARERFHLLAIRRLR